MRTLASNSGPFRITDMVGSSNPITILMVEDSEEDIELTLRGLERAKLQNRIWTVRDGVEELAFLRREAPHLRELPVVVLTVSESEQERFAGRGAEAFLAKAVNFERVAKLVQMVT